MAKFGMGLKDARYYQVFVDGVLHKFVYFADTDEGFACKYLVEETDQPGVYKVKRTNDGKRDPLTETIWGKVEIKDKRTGKVVTNPI